MSNTIHNGSDTILVFGTLPSTATNAWDLENIKILPFETSNAINRNIETEDLKFKAGLDVALSANASTITETVVNNVGFEITGSTYVNKGSVADRFGLTADQLRSAANAGKFVFTTGSGSAATEKQAYVAVIHRPSSVPSTPPTTAVGWYEAWAGNDGAGVEIVLPVVITSLSESEEVGTHVKMDVTFKQAGDVKYKKVATIA